MAKSFSDLVAELGNGHFQQRAGNILEEIVAAIHAHGGKGKLTIQLDLEAKNGQLKVDTSFKVRKPYEPVPASAYWTNDAGELLDHDPLQTTIPFPRRPKGGEPH
jgi:hypothetical protein